MRDLLNILAVVLAALQVIPAYVIPQAFIPFLVGTTIVFGVFSFLFLRVSEKSDAPTKSRWTFVPALVVVLLGVTVAGYKGYTLRNEVVNLKEQLEKYGATGPIRTYLDSVVAERDAQWDHEFEQRYARPTLYLLNNEGTRQHNPKEVQDQILKWRTGTAGMNPEFRGIAGLVGETLPGATFQPQEVAKGMINYVERPLADSDLLNKRVGDSDPKRAKDDIPRRVLVLGDPAVGKSSMMERLDLIQARRARGSRDEPIPVLINLKGMDKPNKERLMAKIRERLGAAADAVLQSRKIVLLVDSLDETGQPQETANAVAELAVDPMFDRTIVAARMFNYSVLLHDDPSALHRKEFVTAILYGLDQTAIEKQILTRSTPEMRQRLLHKLARSETRSAWLQFLRLPLDFDLIVGLMEESDDHALQLLPRGQSEIIRRFTEKRMEQKGIPAADIPDIQAMLARVAANLLRRGVSTRSGGFYLAEAAEQGGAGNTPSATLMSNIETRLKQAAAAGIVHLDRSGRYKFFHLNIQDYYTAVGLADFSIIDMADINVSAQWRQIVLFRVGMGDGPKLHQIVSNKISSESQRGAPDQKQQENIHFLKTLLKEIEQMQGEGSKPATSASEQLRATPPKG